MKPPTRAPRAPRALRTGSLCGCVPPWPSVRFEFLKGPGWTVSPRQTSDGGEFSQTCRQILLPYRRAGAQADYHWLCACLYQVQTIVYTRFCVCACGRSQVTPARSTSQVGFYTPIRCWFQLALVRSLTRIVPYMTASSLLGCLQHFAFSLVPVFTPYLKHGRSWGQSIVQPVPHTSVCGAA